MRSHLDTEKVVSGLVREVRDAVPAESVEVWLAAGEAMPKLAVRLGAALSNLDADGVPASVRKAAARRRPIEAQTGRGPEKAVAIAGPRAGFLGVLGVAGARLSPADMTFLEDVSNEAGAALELAATYEQAESRRERSEAILGRVGDAIVITDRSGRIVEWNRAAEVMFGTRARDAIARSCSVVLGLNMDDQPVACATACPLLKQDSLEERQLWRAGGNGRTQPILANVARIDDAEGNVFEVIHSFRDITKLKEADDAKAMFLATASHELKTPLTVIKGFAQILSEVGDKAAPEERREALVAIERRTDELAKIVDRLLLSSKIETGRTELKTGPYELDPIFRERCESLRAASGRDVVIETAGATPKAMVDPDAFVTVLDHLLDNAVKYSPNGEPIRTRLSHDERRIALEVADSGIGMDAEEAGHCFDRFWQAESTDRRRFGGTGIGLYIVRSLVEAMGGRVGVESARGEGSRFTVSLNRGDVEPPPPARAEPAQGVGEQSVIREFMRQVGIRDGRRR